MGLTDKELTKHFLNGMPLSKISELDGASRPSISTRCKKLKLRRDNIMQKFSNEDLIKLKDLSIYKIANKLGVDNKSVRKRITKLGLNRDKNEIQLNGNNKLRKYFPNLSHFKHLTTIGCYYLGLFYADGSLYAKAKNPNTFALSLHNKDSHILHSLAQDLDLPSTIVKTYGTMSTFKLDNPSLSAILCDLGMDPFNNYKQHMPKIPHIWDFVRGFLDGDGSVSNWRGYPRIQFSINHKQFAIELNKAINNQLNGPYKSKMIWTLVASCKRARLLGHKIWNNPTRCLKRKYQKWLQLV